MLERTINKRTGGYKQTVFVAARGKKKRRTPGRERILLRLAKKKAAVLYTTDKPAGGPELSSFLRHGQWTPRVYIIFLCTAVDPTSVLSLLRSGVVLVPRPYTPFLTQSTCSSCLEPIARRNFSCARQWTTRLSFLLRGTSGVHTKMSFR
jgi:hypothetical protein